MYADAQTELVFPYLQDLGLSFTLEEAHPNHYDLQFQLQEEDDLLHHFYEDNSNTESSLLDCQYYCGTEDSFSIINSPGSNQARTPSVSEYDLGAEGDLFKAAEPILEETTDTLYPLRTAISVVSCNSDAIRVEDMDSVVDSEHLLSEVYYDCKIDLLEKTVIEETYPELVDLKFPSLDMEEEDQTIKVIDGSGSSSEGPIQKSVSCESLLSSNGEPEKSTCCFLDVQEMDLGTALGMRRAYSEGDIKTLGNGKTAIFNTNIVRQPFERMMSLEDYKMEERRQKLLRYRKKKTQRNFGRKIKYACRKALADNQPRVRGRFARTEESK